MGILRVSKFENRAIPVPGRGLWHRGLHPARRRLSTAHGNRTGRLGRPGLQQLRRVVRIASRLAAPLQLLLLVLLSAVYLYADAAIPAAWLPLFAEGYGLGVSDLVLPGCWTLIHLTNRRFGPAYAFGQLVAGPAFAALVALINPGDIRNWLPDMAALSWRGVLSFFLVFGIANFARHHRL